MKFLMENRVIYGTKWIGNIQFKMFNGVKDFKNILDLKRNLLSLEDWKERATRSS